MDVGIFIAQSDSGFGDFISQIQGLLIVTILAGITWVAMTYLIMRRDAERRRRKREGLEPLPSFYKQAYDYFNKSETVSASSIPSAAPAEPTPAFALPDLDDLIADFAPDTNPLVLEEFESAPTPPVKVAAAPIQDEVVLPVQEPVVSDEFSYVPGSNELPGDAVEMMRVWRDVSDGRLIVGMKDQLFASMSEIQDTALRNRFRKLAQDLNQIAGVQASSRPMTKPAPTEAAKPTTPAAVPEAGSGIAAQIETYLQAKLLGTPFLIQRNIHVRSGAGGGVLIEVDGLSYEAVGDVTDPEVRQFLQETIQEWESRQ